MINKKLEQPQPIQGSLKDFPAVLARIDEEFKRMQRNIETVKSNAQEST